VTTGLVSVTVVGLTTVHESKHHPPAFNIYQRSLTSGVSSRDVDRSRDTDGSADRGNVNSGCGVGDSGQVASRGRSNILGSAGSADTGGGRFAAGLAAGLGSALALGLGG
jgi:hypothetical protein